MLLIFIFASCLWAKTPVVILINTTEHDRGGGTSVDYIDEFYALEKWKNLEPETKKIVIREDSNEGLRKKLADFVRADGNQSEIVGLHILSHGARRTLANESRKFVIRLPEGVEKVFAPIRNSFAPNAKIVLEGCLIASGMEDEKRIELLSQSLKNFGVETGQLFAYKSDVYDMMAFFKNDPWNKDIPWSKKGPYMVGNFFPYLTWPIAYYLERSNNKGVVLTLTPHDATLTDSRLSTFFRM